MKDKYKSSSSPAFVSTCASIGIAITIVIAMAIAIQNLFIQKALGQGQEILCGTELSLSIDSPNVSFPQANPSQESQIVEQAFQGPNAIKVNDLRCDNSGFTASTTVTSYISDANTIPYTNLSIKTDNFQTIYGGAVGVSAPIFDQYTSFTGAGTISNAVDILIGDTTVRDPSQWGITPSLKLVVPQGQTPGTYANTLTFTVL